MATPKKKKHPKRPKQSASLERWKKYEEDCKTIDKHNAQIDSDEKKKKDLIKKISKR